ncbi:MAG: hypothetical protein EOM28_07930 [Clostridia bacterium]|nr:hypothetical protein [Anaerotignum sp.]NCC16266.1 hypothetical protein [Clostridia bacterium]
MKETIRKKFVDFPYSLHDARIHKIRIEAEKIVMYFSKGYYKPMNDDCVPVKGSPLISIAHTDLDFCVVYLIDLEGDHGRFSGEKISLEEFISRFAEIDFEIVDETYGYNQCKFSGYFYLDDTIKECIIEIYHFGDMTYIVED